MVWLWLRFKRWLTTPSDPLMLLMKKGFRRGRSDHAIMVVCREAGFHHVQALHVMYYRKQWMRGDL